VPVFWSGEDRVCFLFGVIVVVDTGRVVFYCRRVEAEQLPVNPRVAASCYEQCVVGLKDIFLWNRLRVDDWSVNRRTVHQSV
jgi:hypothetical protein